MTNVKAQMTNDETQITKKYDLAERTAKFGEVVIDFVKLLPKSPINYSLISQVVRSATSVGANYMEADGAESKKDFFYKISLCKKESKETMHWFRMISKADLQNTDTCKKLWQEAKELSLIFSAIIKNRKSVI
ncbi:MAG: four helix bundle protein [Patescibacteria group bacterium]